MRGLPRPELPELREATAAKWRAKCYTATGGSQPAGFAPHATNTKGRF